MRNIKLRWLGLVVVVAVGCSDASSETGAKRPPPQSRTVTDAGTAACCEVDARDLLAATANVQEKRPSPLSRNLVNLVDKNVPTDWSIEEGKHKNIKWVAKIGNRGYGRAVVAGGRVFVNTNNKSPRDPKIKGPRAIIMCFDEKDGKFLWQSVNDMPPEEVDPQAHEDGMCSVPVVDGDKVYFVTPGCQVVCADVATGKDVWRYDLMKQLKVYPCIINACSPLIVGDTVFVMTANGVNDELPAKVPNPKAPSFVALDKHKGSLKWQSNLPGANIIHGQWGNPAYAEVKGQGQVIFPGGDGYLYSLEPATGKLIWKFLVSPDDESKDKAKRNYPISSPVVYENRAYIGIGFGPDTGFGNRVGHFWCIDITKTGDVSPAPDNFDPNSPANKKSALVWHHGGKPNPRPAKGRPIPFGPTISTCVIHDGLVYISEENGYLNCLDARTGQKYWDHDFLSGIWGSPYWVDNKVYIGVEEGDVVIFAHGKEHKVINKVSMEEHIQSTPVVVNGVLYVMTKYKLVAIQAK